VSKPLRARCGPRWAPRRADWSIATSASAGVALTIVFPHARRRIARLQLDGAFAVSMRLGEA
jgi:hypothetical protein